MKREEILTQLQAVFDRVFMDPVVVTAELTANDVEEWDSFNHVSLIVAIEKAFEIRFATGEVEATRNVGDLMALIAKRLT